MAGSGSGRTGFWSRLCAAASRHALAATNTVLPPAARTASYSQPTPFSTMDALRGCTPTASSQLLVACLSKTSLGSSTRKATTFRPPCATGTSSMDPWRSLASSSWQPHPSISRGPSPAVRHSLHAELHATTSGNVRGSAPGWCKTSTTSHSCLSVRTSTVWWNASLSVVSLHRTAIAQNHGPGYLLPLETLGSIYNDRNET